MSSLLKDLEYAVNFHKFAGKTSESLQAEHIGRALTEEAATKGVTLLTSSFNDKAIVTFTSDKKVEFNQMLDIMEKVGEKYDTVLFVSAASDLNQRKVLESDNPAATTRKKAFLIDGSVKLRELNGRYKVNDRAVMPGIQ